MNVIAAFKLAESAIKTAGKSKSVKLNLIDKPAMVVPKMNVTTSAKKALSICCHPFSILSLHSISRSDQVSAAKVF